jgi:hypothetical protein
MLREAAAEHLRKKEMKMMKKKSSRMANLWDDLTEAVLGTSAQIATANLNAIEGTEEKPPVETGDASHRDMVVRSLVVASKMEEITDIKLKMR